MGRTLVEDGKVEVKHRGLVPIRVALCLVTVVGCGRTTLDPAVSVEGSGGSGGWVADASGGLGGALQPTASGVQSAADAVGAGGSSGGGQPSTVGTFTGGTSTTGFSVSSGGVSSVDPDACQCEGREVCMEATGECVCAEGTFGEECSPCDPALGQFEWPVGSGVCETDPCVRLECSGDGECVAADGKAACLCEGGWSGPKCDRRYLEYRIPPFVEDVAFDSRGNGWFRTTQGLLYWDFASTPRDTSDDLFQLYDYESLGELAIDSADHKWLTSGNGLKRVDHAGTPLDASDDETVFVSATVGAFDGFVQVDIDALDRPWAIAAQRSGVFVLENPTQIESDDPEWLVLFEEEKLLELAHENNGVWLATEAGLSYVDLGSSLADPSDDDRIDFVDVPELSGRSIEDIDIDSSGTKWFTTDRGIVLLSDPSGPFETVDHSWSAWTPAESVQEVGNGPLMALGPDDARWLMTPSDAALRVEASPEEAPHTTAYAPKQCPQFGALSYTGTGIDLELAPDGRLLIASSERPYYLDFGGTPFEPEDDVWTRLSPSPYVGQTSAIAVNPSGGFWIHQFGTVISPVGCNRAVQHVDQGKVNDLWDDQWLPMALPGPCPSLEGLDGRGRLWVSYAPMSGGAPWAVLDPSLAYAAVTEDDWTSYTSDDAPEIDTSGVLLGDEVSLWLAGGRFDLGSSLSDRSDDRLVRMDAFVPRSVAVDSAGATWFGYDTWSNEVTPAPLRRLDDAGTPWDPADDVWLDFLPPPDVTVGGVMALGADSFGRKWLSSSTSYVDYDLLSLDDAGTPENTSDDTWTRYGTDDALPERINAFVIDELSNLWLGTPTGVGYLQVSTAPTP